MPGNVRRLTNKPGQQSHFPRSMATNIRPLLAKADDSLSITPHLKAHVESNIYTLA